MFLQTTGHHHFALVDLVDHTADDCDSKGPSNFPASIVRRTAHSGLVMWYGIHHHGR